MDLLVKDKAREDAERILAQHWNEKYPVNVYRIAESMGINVYTARFTDPRQSGAIIHKDAGTSAYLSTEDGVKRRLFTLAHEIGHYCERMQANPVDREYTFTEGQGSWSDGRSGSQGYDLHEFYADEFAGNLLMPQDKFVNLFKQGWDIDQLADYFYVSVSAVKQRIRRLKKDGIIV